MCNSVLAAHGLLWTTMFERRQSCLVGCEGRGNSYQNTLHVVLYVILYYCTPANLLSQNNIATHVCTRAIRSCTQPFHIITQPFRKGHSNYPKERTRMTVFKIFIVATALLLCPSLGAGQNCTRRYQRLLREAAVVKAQCPNAAFHDCCQVGGCVRK